MNNQTLDKTNPTVAAVAAKGGVYTNAQIAEVPELKNIAELGFDAEVAETPDGGKKPHVQGEITRADENYLYCRIPRSALKADVLKRQYKAKDGTTKTTQVFTLSLEGQFGQYNLKLSTSGWSSTCNYSVTKS